ncbi:MAG: RecQ family ATP-dependent DNA helicase [Ignavibacteriae bacterium]|nr:RecQ family ATP-dependent DNA helicase [Ignavibacteriota bacterium]NOG96337.1 RecQ family ATP-dependent DNA helicase [Ignavibacteriota bacterium]
MTIYEALNKYFGYSTFREGQEEIINSIIEGNNVLAVLATGAGKSLCYQIPALLGNSFSIVISPLIALMQDQVSSINEKNEIAAFINSSLDYQATEKVLNQINQGEIKLLYLAPERLENREFAARIKSLSPEYIFVDEAHCISEWGHSFRPSYTRLKDFCEFTGVQKISAFTATATPEVRKDIIKQLGFKKPKTFVKGFERDNLSLHVIHTTFKKEKTLEIIKEFGTPAIVYSSTRKEAEAVSNYLKLNKIDADYYHAGLSNELRRVIQDDFLEGRKKVITATNAFGMGIDKNDIRLVIHTSIPSSLENYYQEIGRAGRDGKDSNAVLFYSAKDKHVQKFILSNSFPSAEEIKFIYNAICDIGKISVGSKNDAPIPLDDELLKFLGVNNFSPSKINAALNTLESSGSLVSHPTLKRKSKVKFLLDKKQLQNYTGNLQNVFLRDLIIFLLKKFGSEILLREMLFDLQEISEDLECSAGMLSDALDNLHRSGIITYYKPSRFKEIDLLHERVDAAKLKIDEESLLKRELIAEAKLMEMVDYAMSSRCRLALILEYFGQVDLEYKCRKCDNCTGKNAEETASLNYVQEIIIQTIHESKGRIKKGELSKILNGTSLKHYARDFSTYGSLTLYDIRDLEDSIDRLMKKELIYLDTSYVYLNEKGKELLAEPVSKNDDKPDYEIKLELFNKLRQARKEAASKFSQNAQIICSDELLRKIADVKPQTTDELLSIEGFKRRTFNKVGEEFLEILHEFKPAENKTERLGKANLPKNIVSTFELLTKGYPLEDIASLLKAPESIISIQIETIIEYMPEVGIEKLINKNEIEQIENEIKKGMRNLKEIKSALPSNISYAKIRVVLAKNQSLR